MWIDVSRRTAVPGCIWPADRHRQIAGHLAIIKISARPDLIDGLGKFLAFLQITSGHLAGS